MANGSCPVCNVSEKISRGKSKRLEKLYSVLVVVVAAVVPAEETGLRGPRYQAAPMVLPRLDTHSRCSLMSPLQKASRFLVAPLPKRVVR